VAACSPGGVGLGGQRDHPLAGEGLGEAVRDTNRQQAGQLAAAETADMAQVMIARPTGTGPGSFLTVNVNNGSSRAIREIYVWADVRGITGRYHAAVLTGGVGGSADRAMRNVPHGPDLYWQYRVILPGQHALF
jgi:hypothetical protein